MISNARVKWAKVFEPDNQYPPAKWSIEVYPCDDDLAELRKASEAIQAQVRAENPKTCPSPKPLNLREKDGEVMFQAKRNVQATSGKENGPPRVVGLNKQPFTELIGNGSVCNVIVQLFGYNGFGGGVTAFLEAVQVVNHVPYKDKSPGVDFEAVADIGGEPNDLPF